MVVPCGSVSERDHAPAPLAAAVVDEKSVEMIVDASAVPAKEIVVVADTAPLLGDAIAGTPGAIVSGAGAGIVAGVDWLVVFSIGGGGFVTPPPPPPRMPIVGMMVNEGVALPSPLVVAPALP